ncbi:hypothetical protein IEO21_09370 [Rhodonia placenta]|uniref:Iminophenyl-pyruvate dimer synthase domain-containing protein n=1 Tax=Rhodonia placenta TaxID=104341 RepID=A0A8H7NUJ3_9APHY|nr:hypothetical protein IEO21_09370 [Postia placenta]
MVERDASLASRSSEGILSACFHSAPLCQSVEVVTTRVGELRDLTTTSVKPPPPEHTLGETWSCYGQEVSMHISYMCEVVFALGLDKIWGTQVIFDMAAKPRFEFLEDTALSPLRVDIQAPKMTTVPIISCLKLTGNGTFEGKDHLVTMLRDALRIELTTIPVFVVKQEMLHMALAGNLITAIDPSGPTLYAKDYIPTYGADTDTILLTKIPLKLERCKKNALQRFLQIEAPYEPFPTLTSVEESVNVGPGSSPTFYTALAPEYNSIGEFYRDLEDQIKLSKDKIKFSKKEKQFSGADFFDGMLVQITDHATARQAIDTIISQGEGTVGYPEAHYQLFLELYEKRGTWTCWPVTSSPSTEKYKDHKYIYQLSLAFDAAYCYLLVMIEAAWRTADALRRRKLIRNIHPIMLDILNPLASELVQQKLTDGENAAPAFNFYETSAGENNTDKAGVELWGAIKTHLDAAIAEASAVQKPGLELVRLNVERASYPPAA